MDPSDGDSSSISTDNVSPVGSHRHIASNWTEGRLLGRGSYGSVYEGIADEGFFFAVKEGSFQDQDVQGRQIINRLEQVKWPSAKNDLDLEFCTCCFAGKGILSCLLLEIPLFNPLFFLQAISLLSTFEHENIVQYYGTYKEDSTLYIFLELASKGSLVNLYLQYHLTDAQASAYTREILLGLKYLHDQNIVHRDIKCANILIDTNGTAKLADFGFVKETEFYNGLRKGTAYWMAPEVVKGSDYGLAADVWSLGCTVLEMMTGQFPYYPLEVMQAIYKIGRSIPPHVPDSISKDGRDFILQCLQGNPSSRPTASQLLEHPFVKEQLPSSSELESLHNTHGQAK